MQKCAKLAESLLVQYREKQEYTQRAADAKQEQLLKEQEMQAQEKAEQTALQRKMHWQKNMTVCKAVLTSVIRHI